MIKTSRGRSAARRLTGASLGAFLIGATLVAAPAHASGQIIDDLHVDQTETRTAGHNVFGDDGVRVYTDDASSQAKAAGYFAVDTALADIGEPVMDVTNNPGGSILLPSTQLVVDFNDDGTPDGILVGEPEYADGSNLYGDNWWLSNGSAQFVKDGAPSHGGGYGSTNNGTLDQWRDEFPAANVVRSGWSLGSGVKGDVTIYTITLGSTDYLFQKNANATTKKLYSSDVNQSETRTAGHNDFRDTSGVRVYTDDASSLAKAAGYFEADTLLADAAEPVMDHRNSSGLRPSVQLVTDFDGDGTPDGILVGETVYGHDWWLSNGSAQFVKDGAPSHTGGSGSLNHGTLAQWRMAFGDANILNGGWSLGSGAKGDGVINSITIGNTTYTFTGKNRAPSAADVTGSTVGDNTVTVTLQGEDADGDPLTYGVATPGNGTATLVDDKVTYQRTGAFTGTDTFEYTVADGRGAESTGTIAIAVAGYPAPGPGPDPAPEVDPDATTNVAPDASDITGVTRAGRRVTVVLDATDADGDEITYSLFGAPAAVELDGNKVTFTPAKNFVGTSTFGYTADDGRGGTDSSKVTIKVVKALTYTTFSLRPVSKSITSKSRPKAYVTVKSTGLAKQATVHVYDGKKYVGIGKLNSSGKVTITFTTNLKKGTHLITVKFRGNSSTLPSQRSLTVKIAK